MFAPREKVFSIVVMNLRLNNFISYSSVVYWIQQRSYSWNLLEVWWICKWCGVRLVLVAIGLVVCCRVVGDVDSNRFVFITRTWLPRDCAVGRADRTVYTYDATQLNSTVATVDDNAMTSLAVWRNAQSFQ